MVAGAKG
jgi:hypothetical protein